MKTPVIVGSIILSLTIFCSTPVMAAAWLVCNPYPTDQAVTHFVVTIDGGDPEEVPYTEQVFDGVTYAVMYEVTGMTAGPHNLEIRARNAWGPSEATFFFIPLPAQPPTNINIQLTP